MTSEEKNDPAPTDRASAEARSDQGSVPDPIFCPNVLQRIGHPAQPAREQADTRNQHPTKGFLERVNRIKPLAELLMTGALVCATIYIATANHFTLVEARKSADAAKLAAEVAITTQRAWLSVGGINYQRAVLNPRTRTPQFAFIIKWQNTGQTPALNVRFESKCTAQPLTIGSEDELRFDPVPEGFERPAAGVIAPGEADKYTIEFDCSEEDFEALGQAKVRIFVLAKAIYKLAILDAKEDHTFSQWFEIERFVSQDGKPLQNIRSTPFGEATID